MILDILLAVIAFAAMWVGSGYSVSGVQKISDYTKISSFLVSFFVLGFFTSISELSVAVFSVLDSTPQVSVGNLIGASSILTLLVIPLLSLIDKSVRFEENSSSVNLPFAYFVISLPVFLILDKRLTLLDGFIIVVALALLFITTSLKKPLLEKIEDFVEFKKVNIFKELSKVLLGVALIVVSSKYIVDTTVLYANMFNAPPFLIGLLLISIGTNLPELSIFVRATLGHKKGIALGDYIGSAVMNTGVFAFLIFFNYNPIILGEAVKYNLFLLPFGSILLLLFIKDRRLPTYESLTLLFLYVVFVIYELFG